MARRSGTAGLRRRGAASPEQSHVFYPCGVTKIARSVRLLRFGGLLLFGCVVDGVDFRLAQRFAVQVKAGASGLGVKVGVDGGQGAEKQAADVGEGAGAAWGDTSLCAESVEGSERVIDALSVLKTACLVGQSGGEVLGVAGLGSRMTGAEGVTRFGHNGATLATGGGAMLASLWSEV